MRRRRLSAIALGNECAERTISGRQRGHRLGTIRAARIHHVDEETQKHAPQRGPDVVGRVPQDPERDVAVIDACGEFVRRGIVQTVPNRIRGGEARSWFHAQKVAELGELRRFPARPRPQLVPDPDLQLVVATLMELLKDRRALLDAHGRRLGRSYELFACALRNSGFRVAEFQTRKDRALAQRRAGELAEQRGNLAGAIACYELALKSYADIGCRRALERLRALG